MPGNLPTTLGYRKKPMAQYAGDYLGFMATFTRVLDLSLFSPLLSRRGGARAARARNAHTRILGALTAAVVFVGALAAARPCIDLSLQKWNGARAGEALPVLHPPAPHRASVDVRVPRRPSQYVSGALAAGARKFPVPAPRSGDALPLANSRPAAAVVACGYDATAPPVS